MRTDEIYDAGELPTDAILVRNLDRGDLPAVIAIDASLMGRTREDYYRAKLDEAMDEVGPRTSLVAEVDDLPVGFLRARVYYGEFGQAEPIAVIDSIGVKAEFRGKHVGQALLRQLVMNLGALHVERIQTQVDWGQFDLLRFLSGAGFEPAKRLCLELQLNR